MAEAATPTPAVADAVEESLSEEQQLEKLLLHEERSCIFETRVERAALCRDRGSAQFKDKNVARAIEWYERALFHVDFDEGTWHFEFMDKHRDAVNEVRLPVHLNLAMCFLSDSFQDLAKVVEHADLALAIDEKNVKALYRGGKAHLTSGNLDEARKKLKRAVQIQPNDKNIREALQLLAEKSAEARAKEKETWGGRLLEKRLDSEHEDDTPGLDGSMKKLPDDSSSTSTKQEVPTSVSPATAAASGGLSLSSVSVWTRPLLVLLLAVVTSGVLVLLRHGE